MKKYLSLILVLLLTLSLLAGCGAKSAYDGMVQENGGMGPATADKETASTGSVGSDSAPLPANQKLIRTIRLEAETEDLEPLLDTVNQRIADLNGYVEAKNIYNGSNYSGSRRYRYANLTIRIPADKLDEFVQNVSGSANVVSAEETVDDVTLSYVATESRIKALETEQERLLELLAQAETMEALLQIEARLTDVRDELETVKSQLRLYDNLVNYGTVHLTISEVKEFTVVTEPETVWDRIGTGFMENLKALGEFFVELCVFIVTGLPILIPLAAVLVALIILIRRKKKNAPKKKSTKEKTDEA